MSCWQAPRRSAALTFGIATAPFAWSAVELQDYLLLSLLGVVSIGAIVLVNQSLKLAPASVVVPYQYTLIVWAILFGYLVLRRRAGRRRRSSARRSSSPPVSSSSCGSSACRECRSRFLSTSLSGSGKAARSPTGRRDSARDAARRRASPARGSVAAMLSPRLARLSRRRRCSAMVTCGRKPARSWSVSHGHHSAASSLAQAR